MPSTKGVDTPLKEAHTNTCVLLAVFSVFVEGQRTHTRTPREEEYGRRFTRPGNKTLNAIDERPPTPTVPLVALSYTVSVVLLLV